MGAGIDLARGAAPLHAKVLDDFKDQLLIVLIKRLKRLDKNGHVAISVKEMDDTGQDILSFNVVDGVFNFELSKKS